MIRNELKLTGLVTWMLGGGALAAPPPAAAPALAAPPSTSGYPAATPASPVAHWDWLVITWRTPSEKTATALKAWVRPAGTVAVAGLTWTVIEAGGRSS